MMSTVDNETARNTEQGKVDKELNSVNILASSPASIDQNHRPILSADGESEQNRFSVKNNRYQERDSWRKITAAYNLNNYRGKAASKKRMHATNSVKDQQSRTGLDGKGRFMKDIVSTTNAVELAISQEQTSSTVIDISTN